MPLLRLGNHVSVGDEVVDELAPQSAGETEKGYLQRGRAVGQDAGAAREGVAAQIDQDIQFQRRDAGGERRVGQDAQVLEVIERPLEPAPQLAAVIERGTQSKGLETRTVMRLEQPRAQLPYGMIAKITR